MDEETAILDALDFEVPCLSRQGETHPAEFTVTCRFCGSNLGLICGRHLAMARASYTHGVACRNCLTVCQAFDDLVSVTPLGGGA